MNSEERLTYTVPESAGLLGISPALLWRLIAEGRVPVLRLGRRTLVTRQTIEGLMAEGSVDGAGLTAFGVRVVHARTPRWQPQPIEIESVDP